MSSVSNIPERIIADWYEKKEKRIWNHCEPDSEYNKKIVAVNNMYGWLYEKGI